MTLRLDLEFELYLSISTVLSEVWRGESESDYFDNTTTTRRRTLAKTTKRYIHRRRHRHSSWEVSILKHLPFTFQTFLVKLKCITAKQCKAVLFSRLFSFQLNSWNLSNPSAVYCQKSKSLKEKSNFVKKCYGQPLHFLFSWFAAKFHSLASWVPTLPILSIGSVSF